MSQYGLKQNSPTTASYIQRPKVTTKMYVIVSLYFIPNLIFKRNGKVSSVMVAIIGTFAAHFTAAQGVKMVLELEVERVKPTFPHSYGALVLCRAGVS